MPGVGRVADPWAFALALGAALFGYAVGVHPLLWIAGALAIVLVHQLAVFANSPTEAGRALTSRQREIIRLIAEDWTDAKIAGAVGIAPREVDRETRTIQERLQVKSRVQIKRWYLRNRGEFD